MKNYIFLFLIAANLFSCTKYIENSPNDDPTIIGTWIRLEPKVSESVKICIRKTQLEENSLGYIFNENGNMTIRLKTVCGENPIYENFPGTFKFLNDTLIHLIYNTGRESEYNIKIKEITQDTFKFKLFLICRFFCLPRVRNFIF